MGNVLTFEAPMNISNIESYFNDVTGLKMHKIIWRTRFLKTVHAKLVSTSELSLNKSTYDYSHLIDVISKVFVLNQNQIDSTMILPFKARLLNQRLKLELIPSCSPFQVEIKNIN